MEKWSLDVITGLKKVVLQISVQREYAVKTFSYFKARKYYIEQKKQKITGNKLKNRCKHTNPCPTVYKVYWAQNLSVASTWLSHYVPIK